MTKRVEVTLTLDDDRRVTLEGPEDFVRGEVQRLVGASSVKEPVGSSKPATISERTLLDEKKPDGHSETVAVLAFALREAGTTEFDEDDMRRAYLRAQERPPKVVGQAIRDAKNKFDYIEAGTTRGKYRLSVHGERTVVFDLPRRKDAKS